MHTRSGELDVTKVSSKDTDSKQGRETVRLKRCPWGRGFIGIVYKFFLQCRYIQ